MEGKQVCKICKAIILEDTEWATIEEKGSATLNNASQQRGDEIDFSSGDLLHKKCRCDYINKKYIFYSTTKDEPEKDVLAHKIDHQQYPSILTL